MKWTLYSWVTGGICMHNAPNIFMAMALFYKFGECHYIIPDIGRTLLLPKNCQ